jgi:N-acetylglucosaminyl-diphospho-decaprenol L-rhamnosyltransferase
MPPAAIVVVTYNSAAVLGPCLDAALRASPQVIVVDNGSSDSTLEEARRRPVTLIANPENRGFAAAVNQAVRATDNPLILLLNPDTVLSGPIEPLCQACRDPKTAAAAGLLLESDGRTPQRGFSVRRLPTPSALAFEVLGLNRLWPSNPVNWHYRCLAFDLQSEGVVEQPAGALFLFRRSVWEQLGGFDERFWPVWFEDVDFCKRIGDCGLTVRFVPGVNAVHQGGHSAGRLPLERRTAYWYGNLLKYAAKHFRPAAFRMLCLAVVVGSMLRTVMGIVALRGVESSRAYGAVVSLAGRGFLVGPRAVQN